MFRPCDDESGAGAEEPEASYRMLAWIYPIGRALAPSHFLTLQEVGRAMINAALKGAPEHVLEVADIEQLAKA